MQAQFKSFFKVSEAISDRQSTEAKWLVLVDVGLWLLPPCIQSISDHHKPNLYYSVSLEHVSAEFQW